MNGRPHTDTPRAKRGLSSVTMAAAIFAFCATSPNIVAQEHFTNHALPDLVLVPESTGPGSFKVEAERQPERIIPEFKTLLDFYLDLEIKGKLKPEFKSKTPDYDLLVRVYEYELANPRSGDTQIGTATGDPLGIIAKDASTACKGAAKGCFAGTISSGFACLLLAEAGPISAVCLAAVVGGGFACSLNVRNNCTSEAQNSNLYSLTRRGKIYANDVTVQARCNFPHTVKGMRTSWGIPWTNGPKVLNGLEITCTDGGRQGAGQFTTLGTIKTSVCDGSASYNAVQGLTTYAGDLVDGLKVQCDKAFDTTTANWVSGLHGGDGGTSAVNLCTEGEYVAGVDIYKKNSTSDNFIHAIQVYCRAVKVP